MSEKISICVLPKLEGRGGPASFRSRLIAELERRGYRVHADASEPDTGVILIIAGTRHLWNVLRAKRRGVRVVQRLDGMNWVHRRRWTGLRHFLRSEYGNRLLALIRGRLADRVIYQSQFARNWWQTIFGSARVPGQVIYNGVDLTVFTPEGEHDRPSDRIRILLVEGSLGGGNEQGLMNAIRLANELARRETLPIELMVAGLVPDDLRQTAEKFAQNVRLNWIGELKRNEIPRLDRSAHLLFSADLNAACPNAVIEAMACGLPVISFATGSLPELVDEDAGRVVPYGSNYWKLEAPEIGPLADAAQEVLAKQDHFRAAARARAEAQFSIESVVERYLAVLLN